MNQTFFSGKVRVRPMPVTDQPASRSEVLARLVSPGGELVVLTDGLTAFRHLSYVELRKGKARGNHYHKLRHETFYVIAGELDLHLQDLATGERVSVVMNTGDIAWINPEIVHTFVPWSAGHAVEFAPEVFDAGDTYRHILV
jgi:quercetin dioxygenase-like cupin family protein